MSTIKELREAAGLTQSEVAKALKIPGHAYSWREANPYVLTIGQTEKLAEVFGVPFSEMWDLVRHQIADNVGGGFNA